MVNRRLSKIFSHIIWFDQNIGYYPETDCLNIEIEVTEHLLNELKYTNYLQKSIVKFYEVN